jgi:hypothetical protein
MISCINEAGELLVHQPEDLNTFPNGSVIGAGAGLQLAGAITVRRRLIKSHMEFI